MLFRSKGRAIPVAHGFPDSRQRPSLPPPASRFRASDGAVVSTYRTFDGSTGRFSFPSVMAFATVIDGIVSGCFCCHGITLLNPEKRSHVSSGLAVQDRQPPTPAKLVRERWSGLSPGVVETARRSDPLARHIVTPGIDLCPAVALLYSQECEDPRQSAPKRRYASPGVQGHGCTRGA